LRDRWTSQITLNTLGKLVFAHRGFSTKGFVPKGRSIRASSPPGKSVDDSDVPASQHVVPANAGKSLVDGRPHQHLRVATLAGS
jgi:hypothetical protein